MNRPYRIEARNQTTAPPPLSGLRRLSLGHGPALGAGRTSYNIPRWHSYSDARKLAELRKMARHYGSDPRMARFVVQEILTPAGAQQREYEKQAAAILTYVQQRLYYVNEPGERIVSPWVTLEWGFGDCDDLALVVASAAESIRLPWRFVLAGRSKAGEAVRWREPVNGVGGKLKGAARRPPRGVQMVHIYTELGWPPFQPQVWKSAEPTIKGAPLGYDPVLNGPRPDDHLRGHVSSRHGLSELGSTALSPACACDPTDLALVGEEDSFLSRLVARLSWTEIVTSAIQSALSAVLVAMLLRHYRKKG